MTAASIPWMPNDVIIPILSELIEPNIVLSGDTNYNHIYHLRTLSHRFRDIIDYLIAKNPPTDIYLRGPVPFGDHNEMSKIYSKYMSILKMRMLPHISSNLQSEIVIHLQPDLKAMNAEGNWQQASHGTPESLQMKDDHTAQQTMTAHHTAALMLSRMMQTIMQWKPDTVPAFKIRLVFYEVDGTCSNQKLSLEDASRQQQQPPTVLPFWDLQAICYILKHWNWISQDTNTPSQSLGSYLTLPTIAWASKFAVDERWVLDRCTRALNEAWRTKLCESSEAQMMTTDFFTDSVNIPGFSRDVKFPKSRYFTQWLTTIDPSVVGISCTAVRGIGQPGATNSHSI